MTTVAATLAPVTSGAVREGSHWRMLRFWILLYSWTTIAATVYGLCLAHVFIFFGNPWTNCPNTTAVIAVHLIEVPLALFPLAVAIFAIRWLKQKRLRLFASLLGFVNVSNLVFFLFEVQLVLAGTLRGAPEIDNWLTLSVAVILLSAVALGVAIRIAIEAFLHHREQELRP